MLRVRTADLHRMHDARPSGCAVPSTPAPVVARASAKGRDHARAGERRAADERAVTKIADRDQRRHLPDHRGLRARGLNAPGRALHQVRCSTVPSVAHGDWWRLITAAFLHGGLDPHRLQHGRALVDRQPVEQYLGRTRYLGLYFVSGPRRLGRRAPPEPDDTGGRRVRRDLRDPRRHARSSSGRRPGVSAGRR